MFESILKCFQHVKTYMDDIFVRLSGNVVKLVSSLPLSLSRHEQPRVDKQVFSITHTQVMSPNHVLTYPIVLTDVYD